MDPVGLQKIWSTGMFSNITLVCRCIPQLQWNVKIKRLLRFPAHKIYTKTTSFCLPLIK